MSSNGKVVKSKYKYSTKDKKGSSGNIDVNMKGFLCSCNNREKDCIREAYNILNKYADELYGNLASKDSTETKVEDIENELGKELQALKEERTKGKYRFYSVKSGAKNLVFISTTLENPVELAEKVVKDVYENNLQQARFLIRLIPVETTCKAHMKNIEKAFEPLAEKHFKDQARSFSIVYNHRMSDSLSKEEVIKVIADKVMAARNDHKVNLKEADVSIVIEVIKSIVLISVVPNYLKYKKYNLLTGIENSASKKDSKTSNDSEGDIKGGNIDKAEESVDSKEDLD